MYVYNFQLRGCPGLVSQSQEGEGAVLSSDFFSLCLCLAVCIVYTAVV